MSQTLSIVIPTFGRGEVLLETLGHVLRLETPPEEILVVDQTPKHRPETQRQMESWDASGRIRWTLMKKASIPAAMNKGLRQASCPLVLFLDDDIVPNGDLAAAHVAAHREFPEASSVVGQVLQPGEEPASRNGWQPKSGFLADIDFPFWSTERAWVSNVMAGNLSVKREKAIETGGFDVNFEGIAYRFETEFARRLLRHGGKILFEPKASIRHLKAARGGTRATGRQDGVPSMSGEYHRLTSASPRYAMGDYYFAMRQGWSGSMIRYMLRRPFREVATRFHLKHPWCIPAKLVGEARAAWRAWTLYRRGPQYCGLENDSV